MKIINIIVQNNEMNAHKYLNYFMYLLFRIKSCLINNFKYFSKRKIIKAPIRHVEKNIFQIIYIIKALHSKSSLILINIDIIDG